MRWRFSLTAVSWFLVLAIATGSPDALAQARLDVFVTPIPNAPFSGVINVRRSIVQPDGSIAGFKTSRVIGRDSRGRIYNESRRLLPVSNTETPQVVSILLYDPQTRVSTRLFPQQRAFSTSTVDRPPATAPPALLQASPTGNSLPLNEFTKEEDLGTHEIEGLPAHGVREIQTIPADNAGTGSEILISDEYWYSDDLRINLVLKHSAQSRILPSSRFHTTTGPPEADGERTGKLASAPRRLSIFWLSRPLREGRTRKSSARRGSDRPRNSRGFPTRRRCTAALLPRMSRHRHRSARQC
jgi:hypothetical protein